MKDPVDHIIRPRLPWRAQSEPAITECGYDASKVRTITRDEFAQRRKDYGQQRAALMTCMTCSQTAARWQSWEEDPRQAMGREVEWESNRWAKDRGDRLRDELVALAELAAIHADEFRVMMATIKGRREWAERKRQDASKRSKPQHR
jgi:hypothetical protein